MNVISTINESYLPLIENTKIMNKLSLNIDKVLTDNGGIF